MRGTFAIAAALTALPANAQFGGREGDVVFLVLSHHGPAAFQTGTPGSQNSAAQRAEFKVTDLSSLPFQEVVPNFPARKTQIARLDADDRFEMITQLETVEVPRTEILTKSKVFTMSGLILNDNNGGKEPIYLIGGALVPFTQGVTIGTERSLIEFRALFWRPEAFVQPFREVSPEFVGPADPPGQTGLEYQQDLSEVILLVPWVQLRRIDAAGNWPAGIDVKVLEEDRSIPSTIQLLRLRPGRKTPPFRIPARTHLFVLQGAAEITSLGGPVTNMTPNFHAYVPANHWITIANPADYTGLGSEGGSH